MRRWLTLPIAIVSLLLCLGSRRDVDSELLFRDIWIHAKAGGNQHLMQSILGNLHILSDLDGRTYGGTFHREERLARDAIWNGGMSGYPVHVDNTSDLSSRTT